LWLRIKEVLCETILSTNLNDDLNSEMWTVFAPTNMAFEALSMGAIENLMDDTIALTDLLLFHVTGSGQIYHSYDLKCDGELVMANGDVTTTICNDTESNDNNPNNSASVTNNSSRVLYQVGAGNVVPPYPQIITTDVPACNGIVHVIDQVLLFETNVTTTTLDPAPTTSPQDDETTDSPTTNSTATNTTCSATFLEVVCGRDDFSTLCTVSMIMGELDQTLTTTTTSNFTFFAPNNDAFAKLGDPAINHLLHPSQHDLLSSMVLFHFVPGLVLSLSDLKCVAGPDSLLTMANGYDSRTVCKTPFIYQKGAGNEPESRRPEIIEANIMDACHGELKKKVVHGCRSKIVSPLCGFSSQKLV
jgi:transforming growth factor-beta-induced protein